MKFQRKLFLQVTILVLCLITCMGAAFILLTYRQNLSFLRQTYLDSFGNLYAQVSDSGSSARLSEVKKSLHSYEASIFSSKIEISLADSQKHQIYGAELSPEFDTSFFPENPNLINHTIQKMDHRSVLAYSSLLKIQGKNYYLIYQADISDLYSQLRQDILMLLLFNSIAGLLSIFMIDRFSRHITRPLEDLAREVEAAPGQDYHTPVVISSDIMELNTLNQSFETMRQQIEQQIDTLQLQNAQKQRFIDGLTHEIRTPLTSIIGFSSLLLKQAENGTPEMKAGLDSIHSAGIRIQELSEDLARLISLREDSVALSSVSLQEILEQIQQEQSASFAKDGIQWIVAGDPLTVTTDPGLLKILLSNLADNGRKAMLESEVRTLTFTIDAETSSLRIRDTGKGIPNEDLAKIFEPFFMVDRSRKHDLGGFGLGLALCDQISRLLRIQIHVSSQTGRGTEFSLQFPVE